MKCMECGKGRMRRQVTRVAHEIRGLAFEVVGEALVCGHCGFQMIPNDLIAEHGRLTDRAYREAAGLLSPEEIRAARERLKMSQHEFACYLGVGEASVKRWELGALQEKSSDNLIRLTTNPESAKKNIEQLCQRLGCEPPTTPKQETIIVTVLGTTRLGKLADWSNINSPVTMRCATHFVSQRCPTMQ